MQQINIEDLKPHPQNDFFFDNITGENWDAFLESLRTSGVIEPIIITQEKIIVSGHQRVRGCEELGIITAPCDIRIYENEDQSIKDLIETNLRQRGIGNTNPIKLGRCIKELERIYGIHNGNQLGNNSPAKTQQDFANELGIDVTTLRNYKKLTDIIPEITELVDTGIVTPTTALSIVKSMSSDEQEQFVSSMDITKKITQKQVKSYIEQMEQLKNKNLEYEEKLDKAKTLSAEISQLKYQLESRPNKEVEPEDYQDTKKKLADYQSDYAKLQSEYTKKTNELQQLRQTIETMKANTSEEQYTKKLKDSTIFFCARVNEFIEKTGGYVWLTEHINELPDYERKSYLSAVNAISAWSDTLKNNINK